MNLFNSKTKSEKISLILITFLVICALLRPIQNDELNTFILNSSIFAFIFLIINEVINEKKRKNKTLYIFLGIVALMLNFILTQ